MSSHSKSHSKLKKRQGVETSPSPIPFAMQKELRAIGKSFRDKCPRNAHATWNVPDDRPDPLVLMEESNKGRMPQLIPVRHDHQG